MLAAVRLFAWSSWFAYRALFQWLDPAAYLFQKLGFPLLQLSFFALVGAFGGAQPLSFYLIGNAIVIATHSTFSIGGSISQERWQGTLPYLFGAPASRVVVFFGRATVHVFDNMLDVAFAFVFAVLLFGLDLSGATWPGVVLSIAIACLVASCWGLFISPAAYLFLDSAFLGNLATFLLLLLSGANIPLADLPGWAQAVSWLLPLTRTIAASRLYASGAELTAGLPLLLGDVLIGLAWALSGLLLWRWIERLARRRGTLEGF